ncbi:hypothetical protein GM3708_838 [Geminocystis sp. NIES-3708]|uniref:cytochrome b/b6 domain-containing protein n=1 Tax=Geminocystis sp. NIES-3708 TaxID=1615909 RepID=UPI0005FC78CD|nr:cytochrome b/b6 domain-containing protein [Geminocystis sp. NIES-3708]BAQ60432.1 hypothetical protein GM3708_838 [Geminocystis sp. NIES-3708]
MSKKPSFPYQPLLLRITHNFQGLFVILAIITAFWTYNTYDGRWGKIFLPDWQEIEGIHGTFGLFSLLIFPFFVIYVIHRGEKKLIQSNSFNQLKLINKPIWWYTLHRYINTSIIFVLTFALFTGKMMDEEWLPRGELNHIWYTLHLISWLIIVFNIALHILMSVKIGGYPLILSMIMNYSASDKDTLFFLNYSKIHNDNSTSMEHEASHNHVIKLLTENLTKNWGKIIREEWQKLPTHFKLLEIFLLLIIISAWLISAFK